MRKKTLTLLLAALLALGAVQAPLAAEDTCQPLAFYLAEEQPTLGELLGEENAPEQSASVCPVEVIAELAGEPLLLSAQADEDALIQQQDRLLAEIDALTAGEAELVDRYTRSFNGLALRLPAERVADVEALEGVVRVRTAATFAAPEESLNSSEDLTLVSSSGLMAGLEDAWEQGLDGAGMVIAVIDTGLDVDHPAFSAAGMDEADCALQREDVERLLEMLNAAQMAPGLTVEEVYKSAKIPFVFNYAEGSADVSHTVKSGDHGTHVSAIAVGVETEDSAAGTAPGAQLLAMKVFGDNSDTATESTLISAVEDAILLGADVINLSMGATSGFSDQELPYTQALRNAVQAGIVVCASAGNGYSSAYDNNSGTDLGTTGNIDTGVVDAPSSLDGVLSVTSVNSAQVYANGFQLQTAGDDRFVPVTDGGEQFGMPPLGSLLDLPDHEDGEVEYAVVPGLGTEEDFDQVNVEGRVALIQRGTLSFSEKCGRAFERGALAAVVYNNVGGESSVGMDLSQLPLECDIPCVFISQSDGLSMVRAAGKNGVGTLTILPEMTLVDAEDGGLASAFASWGPLSDLSLKPELCGVGGSVTSATEGGGYESRSGTSMAAPQVAGMTALLLQSLREGQGLTGPAARLRAETLLMNTAVPVRQEDGVECSPRKQGAGLCRINRAVSTPVWVSVEGSDLPKAELGDDPAESGEYTFVFTAHNDTNLEQTYRLRASVLTETAQDGRILQKARRVEASTVFAGVTVTPTPQSGATLVTVPAGGESSIRVTIRLSDGERKTLRETFENGIYIEGYVYLDSLDKSAPDLSIPMLAFFGDWSQAPLFERVSAPDLSAAGAGEGIGNSPIPFQFATGFSSYLGENPINQDEVYLPERSNALNDSGEDGGVINDIMLDLLRNARRVTLEVLDAQNKVLFQDQAEDVVKSCYQEGGGMMYPAAWSVYSELSFVPASCGLEDGDTFTIRLTGEKDAHGAYTLETLEMPAYVDGTDPEILDVSMDRAGGRCVLRVTVRDNFYTAGLVVVADSPTVRRETWPVNQQRRGDTVTIELDVTEQARTASRGLMITAVDYAMNTASYTVELDHAQNP